MRHVGVVICAVVVVLSFAGCKKTIKPGGAQDVIDRVVSGQTGFHPKDTKCPDGKEAKVGETFDCTFTGPEGPYVAHMRVTKVDGDDVTFAVKTERK